MSHTTSPPAPPIIVTTPAASVQASRKPSKQANLIAWLLGAILVVNVFQAGMQAVWEYRFQLFLRGMREVIAEAPAKWLELQREADAKMKADFERIDREAREALERIGKD